MKVYAVVEREGRYEPRPGNTLGLFSTRALARKWINTYLAKYDGGWRPTLRIYERIVRTK